MRINIANIPFISPRSKNPGTNFTHPVSAKYPRTQETSPQLAEPCQREGSKVQFAEAGQAVLGHGAAGGANRGVQNTKRNGQRAAERSRAPAGRAQRRKQREVTHTHLSVL